MSCEIGGDAPKRVLPVLVKHAAHQLLNPAHPGQQVVPQGLARHLRRPCGVRPTGGRMRGAKAERGCGGRDLGGGREDVVAGEGVWDVGVEAAVRLVDVERPLQRRIELPLAKVIVR